MIYAIIIALCLLFLLFFPISIVVSFDNALVFTIRLAGLTVYRFSPNDRLSKENKSDETKQDEKKEGDEKERATLQGFQNALTQTKRYFDVISDALGILHAFLKKHITIPNILFSFRFGLGDAAQTGIFAGGVYALSNWLYVYILQNYKVKKHSLSVLPDFENTVLQIQFLLKLKLNIFLLIWLLCKERHAISKLYLLLKKKDGVDYVRTSD